MNKLSPSDCNGPIQMSEVSVIGKPWKCSDTNNGYLKQKNGPEESLIGSTAVTTVVQMSGNGGAKTLILPQAAKPSREKCLIAAVFALIIISLVLLFVVTTAKNHQCIGKFFHIILNVCQFLN